MSVDVPRPCKSSMEKRNQVNMAYETVVHWRKNIFLLVKWKAGKDFVNEIMKWINIWCDKNELRDVAFKAIAIMPNLLLQITNRKARSKDNKETVVKLLSI